MQPGKQGLKVEVKNVLAYCKASRCEKKAPNVALAAEVYLVSLTLSGRILRS